MQKAILELHNLTKSFHVKKKIVEAVKNVSLEVQEGEIYGFLGPNGAGKSVTFSIITTLLQPTSGSVKICGYNLMKNQEKIKNKIGYVSQSGGVDGVFNTYDNFRMQGELYQMNESEIRKVSNELIKDFSMEGFANRKCDTLSGGQKRKVELAMGIMHNPKILFLDEPTTGLDTHSRIFFWDKIKSLKSKGMTIFFTTHYLEEADNLCDRLSIMNSGEIACTDTPQNLKKKLGKETITLSLKGTRGVLDCAKILEEQNFTKKVTISDNNITLFIDNLESSPLFAIIDIVQKNNFQLEKFAQSEPSLDDVFLANTGKSFITKD